MGLSLTLCPLSCSLSLLKSCQNFFFACLSHSHSQFDSLLLYFILKLSFILFWSFIILLLSYFLGHSFSPDLCLSFILFSLALFHDFLDFILLILSRSHSLMSSFSLTLTHSLFLFFFLAPSVILTCSFSFCSVCLTHSLFLVSFLFFPFFVLMSTQKKASLTPRNFFH